MKNKINTILFDFDGVLSSDRFYSKIPKKYQESRGKIESIIFSENREDVLNKWMRGRLSYEEVHAFVSEFVDLSVEQMNRFLLDGVKAMELNEELLGLNRDLREKGAKTAIFTDNMDVFDRVLVPHNSLDSKFDAIISSSKFNLLKHDKDGKLFDIAMEKLGSNPEETLVIDDSLDLKPVVENKGAIFYHYANYEEEFDKFKKWLLNL